MCVCVCLAALTRERAAPVAAAPLCVQRATSANNTAAGGGCSDANPPRKLFFRVAQHGLRMRYIVVAPNGPTKVHLN